MFAILRRFRHLFAFLGMIAMGNMASADVGSSMSSFFDEAGGQANITGPGAFQGQAAGYYSGGNVWARFPQKDVSPFNLQLPHARAGCGGIDLFAGSFSFINSAELVALLKATANNAIGFAFQLAIDAVSPQISSTMRDLSQKVQQMNQMNISSCEAAQQLVGSVWPKMDSTRKVICESVGNSQGKFADWARARQDCNNGGQEGATIAGNSDPLMKDQLVGEPHNFTWDILNKSPMFSGYDQQFKEFVMTLVGTVVTQPDPDPKKGVHIDTYGPGEDAIVTALLDGTSSGAPVKILQCSDSACLQVGTQTITVSAAQAIRPRVKKMIGDMSVAIQQDGALGADSKSLLNMVSVPLYKILSVQAAAHVQVDTGEQDVLAELASVDILESMIQTLLSRFDMAKVSLTQADQASATQWQAQVASVRQRFAERAIANSNRVNVTMQIINKTIQLESTLQNSMSPSMASALNFSRGLNAQSLR